MRPASSTAISRSRRTSPVSVSMSTTATCAPNGKVGPLASKSRATTRPSAPDSVATSAQPLVTDGTPATWNAPALGVEHHVLHARLEQAGGDLPPLLDGRLAGRCHRRAAELQRAGAGGAPADRDQVGVAVHHVDVVHRDAELGGGEHRPGRGVALAVR